MFRSDICFAVLLIAVSILSGDALKFQNVKWRFTKFQIAPAALILSIGLCVAPTICSAYSYNEPVVVQDKLDQNDGAADIFAGAFSSSQLVKQTALKNNDYELVKQGLMKQSSEPRALKRRALVSCKDPIIREKAEAGLAEKACVNKVMGGDMQFMLDVITK